MDCGWYFVGYKGAWEDTPQFVDEICSKNGQRSLTEKRSERSWRENKVKPIPLIHEAHQSTSLPCHGKIYYSNCLVILKFGLLTDRIRA